MDQQKIGAFIAECRRKRGYTQLQLSEMLGITDRAISKWETGKSLPDASIMLKLCEILKITVNELLCGEELTMKDYEKEMENRLIEMVKQKEESDKRLLAFEWVIAALSLLVLFIPILIAILLPMEEWKAVAFSLSGLLPALIGLLLAVKIEQVAGFYECKKCGHRFVPRYWQTSFAFHFGRTRYLRCPSCNQRSYAKKVLKEKD